jgi:type II secretory pathway pseudopilin PulG
VDDQSVSWAARWRERRAAGTEQGDTLIEVLIAVIIISLAIGPLLGALIESLSSSAENRSLATLNTVLSGFAESAKSAVELDHTPSQPTFNNCTGAPNYALLSLPTPRSASAGAAVTVFGTGFGTGLPVTTFRVTVGGSPASVIRKQSQKVSGTTFGSLAGMGNMELTFLVPTGLPTGTQVIGVSDGHDPPVSSTTASELDVTKYASKATISPEAGYTLGVTKVRYWTWKTHVELTDCVLNGGIQLVTLHARSPNGIGDTLNFDLRNPTDVHVPVPSPSVIVEASPTITTLPRSGTSVLTFVASVTPASSEPQPTRPVTWSVSVSTGGSSQSVGCATSGPTPGPGRSSLYTCAVTLTPTSPTGRYSATATYPAVPTVNRSESRVGFASVYAANGSGTIAVTPTSIVHASTGNTLTFTYTAGIGGMNGGEVTIALPSQTPPTAQTKWTNPQTTDPSAGGYTVAKVGTTAETVTVSGNTIEVTGVTLPSGGVLTIVYGDGGGPSGVTAPGKKGTYAFAAQQASIPGGTLTKMSSTPKVTVT